MAYTRTTWANGSGGGTPISATNLNNIEVQLVAWDIDPVTSLPGSPANRQIAVLVDSTTAPTYAWMFRYCSGISDANEWLFVGGSPAWVEVATSESTTSASYAALSTAGPSFTLPRAGVYVVEHGYYGVCGTGAHPMYMSYDIGGTGAVDADAALVGSGSGTAMRRRVKTFASASALVSKYKLQASVSSNFQNRWLSVLPVRVT